jgi:hypothetical protein
MKNIIKLLACVSMLVCTSCTSNEDLYNLECRINHCHAIHKPCKLEERDFREAYADLTPKERADYKRYRKAQEVKKAARRAAMREADGILNEGRPERKMPAQDTLQSIKPMAGFQLAHYNVK